jgi:hypothetical protein
MGCATSSPKNEGRDPKDKAAAAEGEAKKAERHRRRREAQVQAKAAVVTGQPPPSPRPYGPSAGLVGPCYGDEVLCFNGATKKQVTAARDSLTSIPDGSRGAGGGASETGSVQSMHSIRSHLERTVASLPGSRSASTVQPGTGAATAGSSNTEPNVSGRHGTSPAALGKSFEDSDRRKSAASGPPKNRFDPHRLQRRSTGGSSQTPTAAAQRNSGAVIGVVHSDPAALTSPKMLQGAGRDAGEVGGGAVSPQSLSRSQEGVPAAAPTGGGGGRADPRADGGPAAASPS